MTFEVIANSSRLFILAGLINEANYLEDIGKSVSKEVSENIDAIFSDTINQIGILPMINSLHAILNSKLVVY